MSKRTKLAAPELPGVMFEDRFLVRSVDNTRFERVGRMRGKSSGFDAEIVLDINTDIFPIKEKDSLTIAIASRVTNAIYSMESQQTHALIAKQQGTLIDQYDYAMYGKIFHVEDKSAEKRTVYASFGGLLMSLTAEKQVIGDFVLDTRIFILIKHTQF